MKLKEMKEKIYRLIEELSDDTSEKLTDDPDYQKKINTCINIIQNELARIKKIPAKLEYDTTENHIYKFPDSMYQIYRIPECRYEMFENEVHFDEEYNGNVSIYYYKYPTPITEETKDDEYEFELSQDALEIMPFGVAGDMLKSDPSTEYGITYSNRYNELKQMLDSRYNNGIIYINTSEAIDWWLQN